MQNHKLKLRLLVGGMALLASTSAVQADSDRLINPGNNHSYQVFTSIKPWLTAKAVCARTGGYLATITSQEENDWLASKGLDNFAPWIGGTRDAEGNWTWLNGESWVYTNWWVGGGYPTANTSSNSLQLSNGGKWINGPGTSNAAYLCEWDLAIGKIDPPIVAKVSGYSGKVAVTCQNTTTGASVQFNQNSLQPLNCTAAGLSVNNADTVAITISGKPPAFASHHYELKTDCGDWQSCKAVAEGLGGHLVTITTKAEQDFVYTTFNIAGTFWIGLSDLVTENVFAWVNGEAPVYSNWDTNQPTTGPGALFQDCVVNLFSSGKWDDRICAENWPAVIEYE